MSPHPARRKYVFTDDFRRVLDERHLTAMDLARDIEISRSHLSMVMGGFKAVSVRLRQKILAHPALKGVPEQRLWKVVLAVAADPSDLAYQLEELGRLLDAYNVPGGVDGDPSPLARVRWLLDELRARERHVEALEGMLSPEALLFVGERLRR